MQFAEKPRRNRQKLNAVSMADVAFLCLIFFLVLTSFSDDKGIRVKLPPWTNCEPFGCGLRKANLMTILLNDHDQLLVENEIASIDSLKEKIKYFITNPNQSDDLADTPKRAILSISTTRSTSYDAYITVYNEIKAAYNELWEEEATNLYQRPFKNLDDYQKYEVRRKIPMVISEAETMKLFNP